MSRLSFSTTRFHGRLARLACPALLALAAPAAHAQGRMMHTPSGAMSPMMRTTNPATGMRSVMPSAMTSPAVTNPMSRTNLTTDALLRRDLRLDSLLLRELRFDGLRRAFGFGPSAGLSWGTSPWWSMWGGGSWGSGLSVIPVGVPSGDTTAVAQRPSGNAEDAARVALIQEKAIAERLQNRRRAFDEMAYERSKAPSPDQQLLGRSRGNPPDAEVLSGRALNALLDDLRAPGSTGRPNALLPLDQQELRHINVTRGGGSIALLKNGGRLAWPAALSGPAFGPPRERLAARAPEAVRQAATRGRVDAASLRQMAADVDELRTLVRQNVKELSFHAYADARNFLQRFDDALAALGRPDAGDFLNGTYDLRAQTVLGLVRQMNDRGLRFAPAGPGDEPAYRALREALAACDRAAVTASAAE